MPTTGSARTYNALFVTALIRSGKKHVNLDTFGASYRDPSGSKRPPPTPPALPNSDASSNTRIAMVFNKAKVGGVVTLENERRLGIKTGKAKIRAGSQSRTAPRRSAGNTSERL